MSLPHPPGDPMAPPVPRTVPMPATPGSPLEPLRPGRRLDRRHWLLAGLLGIVGGALLLDGVLSITPVLSGAQVPIESMALAAGGAALGLVAIVVAFSLAPGSLGRRALGIVIVLVGIGLAVGLVALLFGGPVRIPVEVRWVASPQSLLVGTGIVGWLLASGARWWAFLVVLLAPAIPAVASALLFQGSSLAILAPQALALVLALLALLLSIPRRR
ncbi:hypothetical protein [Agrococcus jejuensis]|uniref:Uncharacterized protein n=1 Tax=Agrococcus jejuensis TaxID=399736 RepID=A0A1G8B874_9MICO|nr:hypothetical protein [Agrococcus jejuensis]SDH29203.1 hypothetical protein SAMN04489720_0719 [Agrococcus jejuensis]